MLLLHVIAVIGCVLALIADRRVAATTNLEPGDYFLGEAYPTGVLIEVNDRLQTWYLDGTETPSVDIRITPDGQNATIELVGLSLQRLSLTLASTDTRIVGFRLDVRTVSVAQQLRLETSFADARGAKLLFDRVALSQAAQTSMTFSGCTGCDLILQRTDVAASQWDGLLSTALFNGAVDSKVELRELYALPANAFADLAKSSRSSTIRIDTVLSPGSGAFDRLCVDAQSCRVEVHTLDTTGSAGETCNSWLLRARSSFVRFQNTTAATTTLNQLAASAVASSVAIARLNRAADSFNSLAISSNTVQVILEDAVPATVTNSFIAIAHSALAPKVYVGYDAVRGTPLQGPVFANSSAWSFTAMALFAQQATVMMAYPDGSVAGTFYAPLAGSYASSLAIVVRHQGTHGPIRAFAFDSVALVATGVPTAMPASVRAHVCTDVFDAGTKAWCEGTGGSGTDAEGFIDAVGAGVSQNITIQVIRTGGPPAGGFTSIVAPGAFGGVGRHCLGTCSIVVQCITPALTMPATPQATAQAVFPRIAAYSGLVAECSRVITATAWQNVLKILSPDTAFNSVATCPSVLATNLSATVQFPSVAGHYSALPDLALLSAAEPTTVAVHFFGVPAAPSDGTSSVGLPSSSARWFPEGDNTPLACVARPLTLSSTASWKLVAWIDASQWDHPSVATGAMFTSEAPAAATLAAEVDFRGGTVVATPALATTTANMFVPPAATAAGSPWHPRAADVSVVARYTNESDPGIDDGTVARALALNGVRLRGVKSVTMPPSVFNPPLALVPAAARLRAVTFIASVYGLLEQPLPTVQALDVVCSSVASGSASDVAFTYASRGSRGKPDRAPSLQRLSLRGTLTGSLNFASGAPWSNATVVDIAAGPPDCPTSPVPQLPYTCGENLPWLEFTRGGAAEVPATILPPSRDPVCNCTPVGKLFRLSSLTWPCTATPSLSMSFMTATQSASLSAPPTSSRSFSGSIGTPTQVATASQSFTPLPTPTVSHSISYVAAQIAITSGVAPGARPLTVFSEDSAPAAVVVDRVALLATRGAGDQQRIPAATVRLSVSIGGGGDLFHSTRGDEQSARCTAVLAPWSAVAGDDDETNRGASVLDAVIATSAHRLTVSVRDATVAVVSGIALPGNFTDYPVPSNAAGLPERVYAALTIDRYCFRRTMPPRALDNNPRVLRVEFTWSTPPATAATLETGTAVAMGVAAALSGATALSYSTLPMYAQLSAIARLATCDPQTDGVSLLAAGADASVSTFDPLASPLSISLGDGADRFHAGAAIGNVIIVIIVVLIQLAVAAYLVSFAKDSPAAAAAAENDSATAGEEDAVGVPADPPGGAPAATTSSADGDSFQRRLEWRRALVRVWFPTAPLLVSAFFLQNTARSAIVALAVSGSALAPGAGLVGLGALIVFEVYLVKTLVLQRPFPSKITAPDGTGEKQEERDERVAASSSTSAVHSDGASSSVRPPPEQHHQRKTALDQAALVLLSSNERWVDDREAMAELDQEEDRARREAEEEESAGRRAATATPNDGDDDGQELLSVPVLTTAADGGDPASKSSAAYQDKGEEGNPVSLREGFTQAHAALLYEFRRQHASLVYTAAALLTGILEGALVGSSPPTLTAVGVGLASGSGSCTGVIAVVMALNVLAVPALLFLRPFFVRAHLLVALTVHAIVVGAALVGLLQRAALTSAAEEDASTTSDSADAMAEAMRILCVLFTVVLWCRAVYDLLCFTVRLLHAHSVAGAEQKAEDSAPKGDDEKLIEGTVDAPPERDEEGAADVPAFVGIEARERSAGLLSSRSDMSWGAGRGWGDSDEPSPDPRPPSYPPQRDARQGPTPVASPPRRRTAAERRAASQTATSDVDDFRRLVGMTQQFARRQHEHVAARRRILDGLVAKLDEEVAAEQQQQQPARPLPAAAGGAAPSSPGVPPASHPRPVQRQQEQGRSRLHARDREIL